MNLREWALPVYTILMQLAAGALLALWVIRAGPARKLAPNQIDRLVERPLVIILVTNVAAMIGAQLHLSRPYVSFLAVLNLRSSWLSREILFTVLFFVTVTILVVAQWFRPQYRRTISLLGWLALAGGAAPASSACPTDLAVQVAWNSGITTASFFISAAMARVAALSAMLVVDREFRESVEAKEDSALTQVLQQALPGMALITVVGFAAVAWINIEQIRLLQTGNGAAQISLQLLFGPYGPLFALRIGAIVLGVTSLSFAAWRVARGKRGITHELVPVYLGFLLILIGEILGRFLFYATHIRLGI